MTERFSSGDRDFTFIGFDQNLVFDKLLKELPNVGNMCGGVGREDDDVVEIEDASGIEEIMESGVYNPHEDGGGVG